MKKVYLLTILCQLCWFQYAYSQKKYQVYTIAFYNLENMFDTIDDPDKEDETSPIMQIEGDKIVIYKQKLKNIAKVLATIGPENTHQSPVVIGIAEVENENVINDLINTAPLKEKGYRYIHYESKDDRGIDVALLYQPQYFVPTNHQNYEVPLFENQHKINTRDILWVEGFLDHEKINLLINHWPSRRGGEKRSAPLRNFAAYKNQKIIEELVQTDTAANIILMGDFNDNPTNTSFKKTLNTKTQFSKDASFNLVNPFESLFKKGGNTLIHQHQLFLFDQIIISNSLQPNPNSEKLTYYRSGIFNPSYLTIQDGKYKNMPFRSFSNNQFTNGYSDHYPVYLCLTKQKK